MYSVTLIGFLKKLFMVAEAAKLFFLNENLRKAQQKNENDTFNNDKRISNNVPETPDTTTEG